MPFVPFSETAEHHMIFNQAGQTVENVFHTQTEATYTTELLAEAAAVLVDWWDNHARSAVCDNVALERVESISLESESAPANVYVTGLPLEGQAIVANPLPNHVTVAVKWSTGSRGRSYRGRTFHIGLTPTQAPGNFITTTFQTGMTANYNLLISQLQAAGHFLVVCSRIHDKTWRTVGVASQILAASMEQTIDSQRRRLPGRGI